LVIVYIEIPIDRNSKRSKLDACVSADGAAMRPFIIVNRVTLDPELILAGYTSDVVLLVHQPHSFMARNLFNKWAKEVFFQLYHLNDCNRTIIRRRSS
jgi:hypothetical protein